MSEEFSKTVTVNDPNGLHLRPAGLIAELASQFQAQISIEKDGEPVDGKSVLSIVTLVAQSGTPLVIRAVGEDAEQAVHRLADLFEQGFPLANGAEQGDQAGRDS